ncbi:ABC transporter permease [Occallatibacter riparius]|uniref:ABC transporter permease n=1 Tax=Occallatibacter riparius TaxID=1002689 RepID=A0A9J7BPF0_9BACT|nr:ABC transporter permease [Occallatibacter riparius]UWZ83626.1 ABC transporter permease [Occallatibacter riparius]
MALFRRILSLGSRARIEDEIDAELREHMAMCVDDNVAQGMSREDAERDARRRFGNPRVMRERVSAEDASLGLVSLWQDVRSAARVFIKSPGFSLVVVATLALGIGANTAIFQLIDAVLLQSLPVKNPRELVQVRVVNSDEARGNRTTGYPAVTNPIWEKLREDHQGLSGIAAWRDTGFSRDSGGDSRFVDGLYVSGGFFDVLGVRPIAGRVFTAADDQPGCGLPGAVISYGFWQQEFGGRPALGQKLKLNDKSVEIIGVTPANFFGVAVGNDFKVAVPICSQPYLEAKNVLNASTQWWLSIIGRLDHASSVQQVAAHLGTISSSIFASTIRADYPSESIKDYLAMKLTAEPSAAGVSMLRTTYSNPLRFLLAIAGVVLLITCANLASLMLARTTARERDMAVRLAIGASRWRLIRLVLGESLLLSIAGALAGAALAQALSRGLLAYLKISLDFRLDWRLFAFLLAISFLTCLLFGLGAALRASRTPPGAVMKAGSHGMTASRGRLGFRGVLVASQVALSLVLLFSALLFTQSLRKLMTEDPGFQAKGVLITWLDFARLQIPIDRRAAFQRELLDRIRSTSGVDKAANTSIVPLGGAGWDNAVWIDGRDSPQRQDSNFSSISPDYFNTLRIPIVAGRDFNDHDSSQSPRVAIVNEAFARKLGLGANPIGARFWREATPSHPAQLNEIVGLVGDTKYHNLRRPAEPIAYLAIAQDSDTGTDMQVLVQSRLPLNTEEQAIRHTLQNVSSAISFQFDGLQDQIQGSLQAESLLATLSGFFGALAVLLTMTGLYGVMSYTVAERTTEIGIRMALGAQRASITALILRKAAWVLVVGLALGACISLAAASAAGSLLFGLKPRDPATLAAAALLLTAVTLLASVVPSMRAANVNPIDSLRSE